MNIRFLFIGDCPHMMSALHLLRESMRECGVAEENLQVIEMRNDEDAARYRFLGSPTIQVDSVDIEAARQNDPPMFGCRVYRSERGLAGVPPRQMIVSAICGSRAKTQPGLT